MDDQRFDELVRAHSPALVLFARSLARDRGAAEEAVQDTLVRAWRYLDSFDARGSFEGWLLRICRRVIIDHGAAATRRPLTIDATMLENVAPPVVPDASDDIIDLLRRLPTSHAEVLVITGVLGYSYDDAAAMLDVPIGTIRSRLARSRAALAELLAASNAAGHDVGAARRA